MVLIDFLEIHCTFALLLLSGIAVLRFSLWLFFTIPILYILFLFKAVKPEESYLSRKFGEEI